MYEKGERRGSYTKRGVFVYGKAERRGLYTKKADFVYERADLSAVYFAMKGLPVVSCGYRNPDVSVQQVKDMMKFRSQAPDEMKSHLCGYIHTIWSSAGRFLRSYYGLGGGRHGASNPPRPDGSVESAKAVLGYFREIASEE